MKLALVQFNPTIGDLAGNSGAMLNWIREAAGAGADLVVFPELAICGYPPRDLLLQEGFLEDVQASVLELARKTAGLAVTVALGTPWRQGRGEAAGETRHEGAKCANSLIVIASGRVAARYDKRLLPTYDVFDEDRYFCAGDRPVVIDVGGIGVGLSLCEDLWRGADAAMDERYAGRPDPIVELVRAGARLIINPSGSPFVLGKGIRQRRILTDHVAAHGVALAAVNQVGGNDDLIFDGHAAVYVPAGSERGREAKLIAAGQGFVEQLVLAELERDGAAWGRAPAVADPLLTASEESLLWRALVLGVRDYCRKTGFSRVVLGLSGGIDSALTACIATAALGAANVLGLIMPSRYSSPGSAADAEELARRLGVRTARIPITEAHGLLERQLQDAFRMVGARTEPDVTEENVQSRLRGLILMAFSNKTGALLLTTGNKSELAVGYCTLYGDMNGGLAVISDVTKAQVYRLARWINAHHLECGFALAPIPEPSITKPPSAELRPDQRDQDTLPPYDIIDAVIERYVGRHWAVDRIAADTGVERALVARIARMIDMAEFKRIQMPIGLKVSSVAFGRGRRRPIAQAYRPGGGG